MWRSTAQVVRRAVVSMWAVGMLLATAGWFGDRHGYWSDKPFTTNLVSSLTGAMFGIPVALMVIQRISGRQATHAESRFLAGQAAAVAEALHGTAVAMAKGDERRSRELEEELRKASAALRDLARHRQGPGWTGMSGLVNRYELYLVDPDQYGVLLDRAARQVARLNVIRVRAQEIGAPWVEHLEDIRLPDTDAARFGAWRADLSAIPPGSTRSAAESQVARTRAVLAAGIHEIGDINKLVVDTFLTAGTLRTIAEGP
ncbi:hypothetical protein HTZ77_44480 [Nonomuraea sp. SMC257]|uniref:Uncharacterized protein n=1 Tax=Nonomuraea montanisoli TaxID=2741721 RepID=A0A7Y6II20_9ACTN|nr:hypothetical protein [Nonomuraea montanisoli]NUW38406.1 hypothetical protein [Nonomuraea montanisoli]